jgi:hypothetical protein
MGVVSGFLQAVLIVGGPHVKNLDPDGRIRFLHILQQVRPDCKTRNQFKDTPTTIEDLARMINEGFKTTASKEDIQRVESRLDGVETQLGRIENLLIAEQNRKIENLEARMKKLEDALAV